MNYLGIDIGTSGCKSVVFDENGVQLALVEVDGLNWVVLPFGGDVSEPIIFNIPVRRRE